MFLMRLALFLGLLVISLTAALACGSSAAPEPTATPENQSQATISAPATEPPTATKAPAEDPPTEAPAQATEPPTSAPAPEATTVPPPASTGRETGDVEGITFVIGEGSKATFTVNEQLASLPLPNDAVVTTESLTGSVHLDGRDSVIEIDLQDMHSDSDWRDQYIRTRMFGDHPAGVLTVLGLDGLPDGFTDGDTVTEQIEGELQILGIAAPLTFDVEARDDGDVVYILGRTSFTWDELQIPKPTARSVVRLDDEVAVEVLLAVRPG